MSNYDFSGWATRNDLLCGDGRTIKRNAFIENDGTTVPLVWNHQHDDVENVLGHALLENRDEGVYAYCTFNESESGQTAKELVQHGDVRSLSIYANKLKQVGSDVIHGTIRELSLVLSGANPGAYIDFVMAHGDDGEYGFEACYDESIMLYHSDDAAPEAPKADAEKKEEKDDKKMADSKEKTVQEVFDELSDDQKDAVYAIIGQVLEDAGVNLDEDEEDKEEGEKEVKHNIFDQETQNDVLMHDAIISDAIKDAKRYGSMKESFIEHAAANNITNLDYLFPNDHELNVPPKFVKEDETWVGKIMNGVKHTPFSRVKATFATLDETEARARGYIKGKMKKEMALALMRRSTTPTTVYIKMKIDRDDVIDITDFDVVTWQRNEMRGQLDKELARAILIGDGRDPSSEDKINEQNIRPILTDNDFYTIKYVITEGVDYKIDNNSYSENDSKYKGVIRGAVKSRRHYKGSGNPTLFTTEKHLTNMLLIEDQNGRRIYESIQALATAMRVKDIVTVTDMEVIEDDVYGIIVNPADYTAGADKGGAVSVFDDFDIDYNQMKYLMETRMSGALTVPYSAIVLRASAAPVVSE